MHCVNFCIRDSSYPRNTKIFCGQGLQGTSSTMTNDGMTAIFISLEKHCPMGVSSLVFDIDFFSTWNSLTLAALLVHFFVKLDRIASQLFYFPVNASEIVFSSFSYLNCQSEPSDSTARHGVNMVCLSLMPLIFKWKQLTREPPEAEHRFFNENYLGY